MPTNPPKAKVATERDMELMRRIGQSGLDSFENIKANFWADAKERTARERLLQLEKAGWIEAKYVDARKPGELIFTLTTRGEKLFTRPERDRFMTARPQEYNQQLLAQDSRTRLERQLAEQGARLLDWKNEHELKSAASKNYRRSAASGASSEQGAEVADAQAIILNGDGQTITLDIEIDGAYFGKQLAKKVSSLSSSGQPALWVTTPGRTRTITQALQPHPQIEMMVIE